MHTNNTDTLSDKTDDLTQSMLATIHSQHALRTFYCSKEVNRTSL